MAIIKMNSSKASTGKIEKYLKQESKTLDELTSGINCDSDKFTKQVNATQELYNKTDKVRYFHVMQSFSPKDNERLTYEQAHELGKELAEKQFKGHEVLVVTHIDKEHIHNHLVVNSVCLEDGKKYQSTNKSLWDIKRYSNKQCEREGLTDSIQDLNKRSKDRVTTAELRIALRGGESFMGDLKEVIKHEKVRATDLDSFRKALKANYGVETRITKNSISYKHPNCKSPTRGKRLGEEYTKESLENGFVRAKESIDRGTVAKGTIQSNERTEQEGTGEQSSERNIDGLPKGLRDIETRTNEFSSGARGKAKQLDQERIASEQQARAERERVSEKQRDAEPKHKGKTKHMER